MVRGVPVPSLKDILLMPVFLTVPSFGTQYGRETLGWPPLTPLPGVHTLRNPLPECGWDLWLSPNPWNMGRVLGCQFCYISLQLPSSQQTPSLTGFNEAHVAGNTGQPAGDSQPVSEAPSPTTRKEPNLPKPSGAWKWIRPQLNISWDLNWSKHLDGSSERC